MFEAREDDSRFGVYPASVVANDACDMNILLSSGTNPVSPARHHDSVFAICGESSFVHVEDVIRVILLKVPRETPKPFHD